MNEDINLITEKIIGCAINIHKELGPGLLESIYESAMCVELNEINFNFECYRQIPVIIKTKKFGL